MVHHARAGIVQQLKPFIPLPAGLGFHRIVADALDASSEQSWHHEV
jgi:hypothetical protein